MQQASLIHMQEDRVNSIQSRIAEVRSRIQSLSRDTDAAVLPAARQNASHIMDSQTTESAAAQRPVSTSSSVAVEATRIQSSSSPHASGRLSEEPELSREAFSVVDKQMKKIDEQSRQIQLLQAQLQLSRDAVVASSSATPTAPLAASFQRGNRPQIAPVASQISSPDSIQVHLSPGVSTTSRRATAPNPSTLSHASPSAFAELHSHHHVGEGDRPRTFEEMQALLRAKIAAAAEVKRSDELDESRCASDFVAPRPDRSLVSHMDAAASSATPNWKVPASAAAAAGGRHPPADLGHNDEAYASVMSTSLTGAAKHARGGPTDIPTRGGLVSSARESSPPLTPVSTNLTRKKPTQQPSATTQRVTDSMAATSDSIASRSDKQPVPREASSGSTAGGSLIGKGAPDMHLMSLSGAEVFAILRLRCLIASEGITGEHLLPPTLCHEMHVTHNEYTQLVKLRELLALSKQQQPEAFALQDQNTSGRGSLSRSRSPQVGRSTSPSAGQAAFEKHRQRLAAVREARQRKSQAGATPSKPS